MDILAGLATPTKPRRIDCLQSLVARTLSATPRSLFIIVFCVPSLPAHAQDDWQMLRNPEFKFRFYHPPSWNVATLDVPHSRGAVMTKHGSTAGICSVGVFSTPQSAQRTQRQLNEQMDAVAMKPRDWIVAFDNAFPDIQIVETQKVKLQNQAAQLVVTETSSETLGSTTYLRTVLLATLSPGLSWKISCAASGHSMAEARAAYKFLLPTFNGILRSFFIEW